jgi:hypothetical protein
MAFTLNESSPAIFSRSPVLDDDYFFLGQSPHNRFLLDSPNQLSVHSPLNQTRCPLDVGGWPALHSLDHESLANYQPTEPFTVAPHRRSPQCAPQHPDLRGPQTGFPAETDQSEELRAGRKPTEMGIGHVSYPIRKAGGIRCADLPVSPRADTRVVKRPCLPTTRHAPSFTILNQLRTTNPTTPVPNVVPLLHNRVLYVYRLKAKYILIRHSSPVQKLTSDEMKGVAGADFVHNLAHGVVWSSAAGPNLIQGTALSTNIFFFCFIHRGVWSSRPQQSLIHPIFFGCGCFRGKKKI